MASCWDRFDRKTVLFFTGYKSRVAPMQNELERVGLGDAIPQWQFPTPLDQLVLSRIRHTPSAGQHGYFNCSMGHYFAMKTAYHLGCKTCLIMEDDIRFLKDPCEIAATVEALPDDFDVALLDLVVRSMKHMDVAELERLRRDRRVNDRWAEFDMMRSLGCYALSRKGMERLIYCYEAVETDRAVGKMRICDHFLNRRYLGADTKMYFAVRNVAIQRQMGKANSEIDEYQTNYVEMGIDPSLYEEA